MKKRLLSFLSLLLIAALLAGCTPLSAADFQRIIQEFFSQGARLSVSNEVTPFSQMEYRRPDLDHLRMLLDEVCEAAKGNDPREIMTRVDDFYEAQDWFYTCSSLAQINYCLDLTSPYWQEENNFCSNASAEVSRMSEEMHTALAASACRGKLERYYYGEGALEAYSGEPLWDGELIALMERESDLVNQYYVQSGEAGSFLLSLLFPNHRKQAQLLVDLIQVRNEIAAYAGYDSYPAFANDYYYYRDYTLGQLDDYLEEIRTELAPVYQQVWEEISLPRVTSQETLDYVSSAAERMGGTVQQAAQLMLNAGLYDIAPGSNKYNSSFELYLVSYGEPFLFINPQQSAVDFLSLAHEFGHFCNDYATQGYASGIDVCEFFSQGMEYLTLCCSPASEELTGFKLQDSLATYVEQACFARFEQEMYQIPPEQLSVDALCDLYVSVSQEYGYDPSDFSRYEFVSIEHFYTSPMYIPSYILSNDAALQLYRLECENPGEGLRRYEENLTSEEPYLLAFLEEAGLESPFTPDRIGRIAEFFRQEFPAQSTAA